MLGDAVGERTVQDLLVERAARFGPKTFMVFEDGQGERTSLSYDDLLTRVRQAAAGFESLGVTHGDAVVIHLRNSPDAVIASLALAYLGAVAVPSNAANAAGELAYVIDFSEAVGIVTSSVFYGQFAEMLGARPGLRMCLITDPAALPEVSGDRPGFVLPLAEVFDHEPISVLPPVGSDDLAQLMFTSGTTARPKAVMITHANLLIAGERTVRVSSIYSDDRMLTALPTFHANALGTLTATITAGATLILLEEYRASKFWRQVVDHEATTVNLVSMFVRTLLAQPVHPAEREHCLRRTWFAINVTDEEKDEFEERFGVEFINGYGLTEAMVAVTNAPLFGDRRWPSVGLPAFDRVVRIVDEEGRELPAGQVGEITVEGRPGRTIMKGYFKDPEATANTIRDGWLHTGDYGYFDEKGYVYFVDRKKDMIKRAGENVSASEVEAVLLECPAIAEAAVIGVPDPIRDQAVSAFVVLADGATMTESEVVEYCAERLAKFKVPSSVLFLDRLPRTSIGKIQKKTLGDIAAERTGS